MKIKYFYALFIAIPLIFLGWMLYAHNQAQTLKNELITAGLFTEDLSAQSMSTNLTGNALILYNITHPDYPQLTVQRGQFQNNAQSFKLILRALQGSLFEYLHQNQIRTFHHHLMQYNPATDLLKEPLITLAILGEDTLNLDISITAVKTAPNQIILDLIVYQNNQQRIHFSTKFSPNSNAQTLFDSMKASPLMLQLEYINPAWKDKLDDYSLSKNKPFITEGSSYQLNW